MLINQVQIKLGFWFLTNADYFKRAQFRFEFGLFCYG